VDPVFPASLPATFPAGASRLAQRNNNRTQRCLWTIDRIFGWAAHVIEQLDDNRLIRPGAEYIGPAYAAPYVPMNEQL
jgi:citrate synthase